MVTIPIKRDTIYGRFCDLCGDRIPNRNHRNHATEKCIICKKDVCFKCQIQLRRKERVRPCRYVIDTYGVICHECCKKLKIPIR